MWIGTDQAKASAMRWIEGVHANMGGTEMAAALVSTIAITDSGKADIFLVTDGEIEGIDEVIDVAMNAKHRIFVVAIGSSPAEGHLRRLAAETGGYCDFVAPGETVEPAILRMFGRMRAPRVRNLRVKWPNSLKTRWEQKVQAYAFEGDVLHVHAFVDTPEDMKELTSVRLWGQVDDSDTDVLMGVAPLSLTDSSTNILARMAANAKYAELYRKGNKQKSDVQTSERIDLAITYRLITEETNFILVHERTDTDKATVMPDAHKVPQMLAGGWGGTGSVVRSGVSPVLRSLRTGSDDIPFGVPSLASASSLPLGHAAASVWRTNRTKAAARVDALSASGMDDFDIPAFLRKQSDFDDLVEPSVNSRNSIDKSNPLFWKAINPSGAKQSVGQQSASYVGITPAGLEKWLSVNHSSLWPSTYAELRDLGLGLSICEWLEFEIGRERNEQLVVATFLSAVREFRFKGDNNSTRAVPAVKGAISIVKVEKPETELASEIRLAMAGVGPQTWPVAVVNFPEECC
jgi:Ca-activated chloride channel family protein